VKEEELGMVVVVVGVRGSSELSLFRTTSTHR
jgi:hypothetical protein